MDLHRISDDEQLNFDYQRFRWKLSQFALKIFVPFLPFIYFIALFLCRVFTSIDIRTIIFFILLFITFIVVFLVYSQRKSVHRWMIVILLITPILLTYQTEQFHIFFSTIAILLIYSLFTFTLVQLLLITLTISLIDLILLWRISSIYLQLFPALLHHGILHFIGLFSSMDSLRRIRQHFYTYQTNLQDKNQANVDCKKLHTILRYSHRLTQ